MTDYAHTEQAALARREKARVLARFLWTNGYTVDQANAMTPQEWGHAARVCGKNQPSSESRALTLELLQRGWDQFGPPPPTEPEPAPTPAAGKDRPVIAAPTKHRCHWDGCDQPGRLYPGGWRCDTHAPWALKGSPAPWTFPVSPLARRATTRG